jgi:hypothetical protein
MSGIVSETVQTADQALVDAAKVVVLEDIAGETRGRAVLSETVKENVRETVHENVAQVQWMMVEGASIASVVAEAEVERVGIVEGVSER